MPAVLALVVVLVAAASAWAAPPRVLVTGDSMVQPLDRELVRPVERRGGRVVRDPRPGTNLTRPLVLDWLEHSRRQMRSHRPRATVMFIGANDFDALRDEHGRRVECCRLSWIEAYAARVGRMMSTYRRSGRGDVYWLTLPAPRTEEHARRVAAVNAAIARAGSTAAEGVHVVDTVPVLTPGYRYRRRMLYRGRMVVVRDEDGTHLTRAGARVVRDLVVSALRRDRVVAR